MKTILVYVTTSGLEEARRIGNQLVALRLAACVNILPPIESIYHWDGKIQNELETPLLAKTTENLYEKLESTITSMHSFTNPCIVAVSVERGSAPFLDWIAQETASA